MATSTPRIEAPSRRLALSELPRAVIEFSTLPFAAPILNSAPEGDGHPVLVLPGFIADDGSTVLLRRYLDDLGYLTHGWELGSNLGPRSVGWTGERLSERVEGIYEATGRRVSLIGQSLGGVMSRETARRLPHAIRQVITLGSPFTGNPKASTVWRLYERLSGQKLDTGRSAQQMSLSSLPPPVPSTSIFSKSDGVVAWQNCIEPEAEHTDNIEVCSSHCGMGVHPAVLYAIADRLAQAEGAWRRFDRSGWRSAFYPCSGHNLFPH